MKIGEDPEIQEGKAMLNPYTISNEAERKAQPAPKEQLFTSWLSGMVPMLSVPDAGDSDEASFFFGNDLLGRWTNNQKEDETYSLLVHSETHGRVEWEAALLEAGDRRWVLTCLHDLAGGLVRYRIVDEASGWWLTVKEEMPAEERFDRDVSSSSRVGELYNRYLKSPYTLEFDWKLGHKITLHTIYEDAVLSVVGPMLLSEMRRSSLTHSFGSSVPMDLQEAVADLVAMLSSGSSRVLMRFDKPIRLLGRVLEEYIPTRPASPLDWSFQLAHDVVYRDVGMDLDPATVTFIRNFESIDEDLLTLAIRD